MFSFGALFGASGATLGQVFRKIKADRCWINI